METRIGFGYDSHVFKPGVPLRIGGLTLDHPEGLAGHSDGDVLLHAITDALLGAIAAGDIGSFFPPGDPRWKDADSAIFLNLAMEELQHAGYRIVNIDTTLILAAPKIAPISDEMRARIADLLGLGIDQVSIKAKTPEGPQPRSRRPVPRRRPRRARHRAGRPEEHERRHRKPAPARRRRRRPAQPASTASPKSAAASSTTPRTSRRTVVSFHRSEVSSR